MEYEADTIGPRHSDNADSLRNPDEVVLMQSTGLKDHNGKEIFEGDIVRVLTEGSLQTLTISDICMAHDLDQNWYEGFDMNIDAEVIGNIYENPELLQNG